LGSVFDVTDPESFPAVFPKRAGILMTMEPVHAIAGRTIRHWTTDSREFIGEFQEAAPALPYTERHDGGDSYLLASKLARVKSALERRVS
jgi:hypothetical protein